MIDSSTAFASKPFLRLALLAGIGGMLGGGQAILGLLLSEGGVRFSCAFAALGGLTWLAARASSRPFVAHALRLSGRGGVLTLTLSAGAALGLLWVGHAGPEPGITLWKTAALIALPALGGALVSATGVRSLGRCQALIGLTLGLVAGFASAVGLRQFYSWDTAKLSLWGAMNGASLGIALSWLIRNGAGQATATSRRLENAFVGLVVLLLLFNSRLPEAWNDRGLNNLYVDQARAFLRGRLDVQGSPNPDTSYFQDKMYVASPPFPAVVLLPVVWAQDRLSVPILPMTLVGAGLVALSAGLLNGILRKLAIGAAPRYWVLAAFVFGTGYWAMVLSTEFFATYFALAVSAPCMLLALRETLGQGRGWLVGLFLGFAFLSRQLEVLAGIFLAALLLDQHRGMARRLPVLNIGGLAVGLSACVGLYLLFNYARFGNALDSGQAYIIHRDAYQNARYQQFGLFSPAYIPDNLYYTFLHGFHIEFRGGAHLTPSGMDPFGTSITFASPFLFLALWGRWKPRLMAAAWASVLLILIALLCFYANGWIQINTQRYALDYVPILVVLVALGAKRVRGGILEGLTLYSIGLNLIALPFVPAALWW